MYERSVREAAWLGSSRPGYPTQFGRLDAVGEARAVVVAFGCNEDLSFDFSRKAHRMDDPVTVTLEIVRGLRR
jgi:hypothetical protein